MKTSKKTVRQLMKSTYQGVCVCVCVSVCVCVCVCVRVNGTELLV